MPKRTRQHILETDSRNEFSQILPNNWIFRDITPDYGIDGIVEVFDETGNASGGIFLVQLKATDEKLLDKALSVVLKTDTGEYYKNIILPVLIVLFHSNTKTIYANFFDKKTEIPKNQKTFTFNLSIYDSWDNDLIKIVNDELSKIKSATDIGIRHKLIEEYYKYKQQENLEIYSNDKNNDMEIEVGSRVNHYVFGEGIVEQITDCYMFARFDEDTTTRKFLPCSFREFTVI